jgi:hypothetical protein
VTRAAERQAAREKAEAEEKARLAEQARKKAEQEKAQQLQFDMQNTMPVSPEEGVIRQELAPPPATATP